jgi:hypothetical protein
MAHGPGHGGSHREASENPRRKPRPGSTPSSRAATSKLLSRVDSVEKLGAGRLVGEARGRRLTPVVSGEIAGESFCSVPHVPVTHTYSI